MHESLPAPFLSVLDVEEKTVMVSMMLPWKMIRLKSQNAPQIMVFGEKNRRKLVYELKYQIAALCMTTVSYSFSVCSQSQLACPLGKEIHIFKISFKYRKKTKRDLRCLYIRVIFIITQTACFLKKILNRLLIISYFSCPYKTASDSLVCRSWCFWCRWAVLQTQSPLSTPPPVHCV